MTLPVCTSSCQTTSVTQLVHQRFPHEMVTKAPVANSYRMTPRGARRSQTPARQQLVRQGWWCVRAASTMPHQLLPSRLSSSVLGQCQPTGISALPCSQLRRSPLPCPQRTSTSSSCHKAYQWTNDVFARWPGCKGIDQQCPSHSC
jgi:hypothetical protein